MNGIFKFKKYIFYTIKSIRPLCVALVLFMPLLGFSQDVFEQKIIRQISEKCPAAKINQVKSFSLDSFNPPDETLSHIKFPGSKNVLFRGIRPENPQFDDIKVLKALLGDSFYLPSPMMWGIQMVFNQERSLDQAFLPVGQLPLTMQDYFRARYIESEIKTLLDCHSHTKFTDNEITVISKTLMDLYFSRTSPSNVISRYLNMRDSSYYLNDIQNIGFGNNAVDLVISSYYDQIASFYGDKILVFKDQQNRSVDLGFFNFKKNGTFWDMWIDNGEVNTPGYLRPDDLVGFQKRVKNRDPRNRGSYEPKNPISYGLYKWEEDGNTYAILVAGLNQLCMLQDPKSQKVYFCENNWESKIMQSPIAYPVIKNLTNENKAPMIGVFSSCKNKKCNPQEVINNYGSITPHSEILSKTFQLSEVSHLINLAADNTDDFKMEFTLNDKVKTAVAIDSDDIKGKIIVIEATYFPVSKISKKRNFLSNATIKAAGFLNGKQEVKYKVSNQYLSLPDPTEKMAFEIKWRCGGSDKILTQKILDNAEGKELPISCSAGDQ